MSTVVSHLPTGRNAIRKMICRIVNPGSANNPTALAQYAEKRWGVATRVAQDLREKAAVAAIGVSDVDATSAWNAPELFPTVLAGSIIGKMTGLRRVPFNRRLINVAAGARGYWVGEAEPKPLSSFALAGSSLAPMTVAVFVVQTDEAMKFSDTEALLQTDVMRAMTEAMDEGFIDAGNAGVADAMPASITHASSGAVQVATTGNPAKDVEALVENFTGDLDSAYLVTDPLTATRIALARDAGGSFEFPDAGPKGGSILKIPLITSRGSPIDTAGGQLALVDAGAVAVALEGMSVDRGESAAAQMSDTPDSAVTDTTTLISFFQNNLVGLRAVSHANWDLLREGAVVTITGCTYATV